MSFYVPATVKVNIVQGSAHVEPIVLENEDGTPFQISTEFDDIKCDLRERRTKESPLIKSISLGSGITITLINTLNLDLTNDSSEAKYYGDVRFLRTGTTDEWDTLLTLECTNTLSVTKK